MTWISQGRLFQLLILSVTITTFIIYLVYIHVKPSSTTTYLASTETLTGQTKNLIKNTWETGHIISNNNTCPERGKNLQLLVIITSAPSHESARMGIRQTWGHFAARTDVSILFMLGTTTNVDYKDKIENEQFLYQDILQGKFIDSYDNLTLKSISILEWVINNCPETDFLLKTDDDMFINIPRLLTFITGCDKEERAIYGKLAHKWKPDRNKKSKYYISPLLYKQSIYPDFTTGPAYLIPGGVIEELYAASLNYTYFKLEDVFLTGIVSNDLNIKRINAPEFLNMRIRFDPCAILKGISIHNVKAVEQLDLWKKLLEGPTKCK
ncbi:hypothetical protein FQR65_LT07742 [Abscondita terminalis]|nr:hypothetical protein FQR65_LT07742 [Abscondita terminalis]